MKNRPQNYFINALQQRTLKKITHFEIFFQSALKIKQPQRTLNFFLKSALNLGLDQRGLIFFSKCVEIRYSLIRNEKKNKFKLR
jgi:hypothetical protein